MLGELGALDVLLTWVWCGRLLSCFALVAWSVGNQFRVIYGIQFCLIHCNQRGDPLDADALDRRTTQLYALSWRVIAAMVDLSSLTS